jgi:fused signal recognition particle receptor
MFGFLRRKKQVEPAAQPADAVEQAASADAYGATAGTSPVVAQPQPPLAAGASSPSEASEQAASDAELERMLEREALAAAPDAGIVPDAGRIEPPDAQPAAPAAKERFWSRFIPGGASAPAPEATPAPLSPDAPTGVVLEPAETADRKPWLARLKQGLSRTRGNLAGLFIGVKVDEALFEDLETALLSSDAGVETTRWLLAALRERVRKERLTDGQQVKAALRALLVELMLPLEQPVDIDRATPLVLMIAGVNGAGKTTSIGKLARHLRREGKSVLLAAGDTFRAAAREQLALWGSRNEVDVISQQGGDPAAVAFDAVAAGRARGTGVVMIDTAGRLPTQQHLMDELKKVRRVLAKAMDGAPHEVLLVLDGNTGQNMLAQVRAFDDAVQLTGLIVTKLDGTAKGGALAALAHTRRERPIPVYFIGVGEGIDDLQAFSAEEFAGALVD